jgi:hypothetical protein
MLIFEELVVGHEQYITFAFTPAYFSCLGSAISVFAFGRRSLVEFFSSDVTHGPARCDLCFVDLIRRQFPRTHFASAKIKDIYWSGATSGI